MQNNDLVIKDKLFDVVVGSTKHYLTESGQDWGEDIARNVQGTYHLIRQAMSKSNTKPSQYEMDNVLEMIKSSLIFKLSATMIPAQCYIISREKGYGSGVYELQYGIQGNGWEVIAEEFGKNVSRVLDVVVVREGDTYMENYYERGELVPFAYKPYQGSPKKFRDEWGHATRRVTNVVFVLQMNDNSIKYLGSERESVKKSIIAQVKQNIMYSELNDSQQRDLLNEMDKYTVDELLYDEGDIEWTKRTYPKKVWVDGKKVLKQMFVISDNYISPSAKESMVETKMRSEALKRLPKTFDSYAQKLFEDTYEYDYRGDKKRENVIDAEEVVEKSNEDFTKELEKEETVEEVVAESEDVTVESEVVETKKKLKDDEIVNSYLHKDDKIDDSMKEDSWVKGL